MYHTGRPQRSTVHYKKTSDVDRKISAVDCAIQEGVKDLRNILNNTGKTQRSTIVLRKITIHEDFRVVL